MCRRLAQTQVVGVRMGESVYGSVGVIGGCIDLSFFSSELTVLSWV